MKDFDKFSVLPSSIYFHCIGCEGRNHRVLKTETNAPLTISFSHM